MSLVFEKMRLSTVRKRPESSCFQALGRFETVGSNLRYGIPKEVATVLNYSRKVSKILCLQVQALQMRFFLFQKALKEGFGPFFFWVFKDFLGSSLFGDDALVHKDDAV